MLAEPIPGMDHRVVAELRRNFLEPPSTLPYNLSRDLQYLQASTSGTWTYIHKHLQHIFAQERQGFFVEAGALDGQQLSNTLWMEQELGWTGLLIEPDTSSYRALRAKRRKAWISNTCLSQDGFARRSIHVAATPTDGSAPPWHVRGASYQYGINRSNFFKDFLRRADQTYMTTTCFPLVSYIIALNISKIDFFSLDTQGMEEYILKAVPWEEVSVRVLVIEIEDSAYAPRIIQYLTGKGYVLLDYLTDYIFVKQGDPVLNHLKI
nr:uncharacterized protein LOC128695782 [Cherax quadricarinatus]